MHRVRFDGLGKVFADGAVSSIGGVGCAHDFAVFGNRIFTFEDLNDNGARCHECDEIVEERTLFMHTVEAFGLFLGHVDTLRCDNAKTIVFKTSDDLAGQVTAGRVRLDDRKSAFESHWAFLSVKECL